MIFNAIVALMVALLTFVLGLFPTFTAPALDFSNGGSCTFAIACEIGGNLGAYTSKWINITILIACFNAILIGVTVAGTVKLIVWVYEKFPGKAA